MMDVLYPYFLTIHLICAIIFLGYLFLEVLLSNDLDSALKPIARFLPLAFFFLLLSGGAMISRYVNSDVGFFNTTLQQMLVVKTILALILASLVVFSMFYWYVLKKTSPIQKFIHPIALTFGAIIVVLAKFAFFV